MACKFDRVALDRIDETDVSLCITTPQDKPALDGSIRRIGLTSPPAVKEADDQSLKVVSGYRRIRACRQLGWRHLPCRILPSDTSWAQCVEFAIADNVTQRSLNLVEQARCLRLLSDGRIPRSDARTIAEALGIPLNDALNLKLTRIVAASDAVQEALVMGSIGLPTALQLAEMVAEDAQRMTAFFEQLPMGLNRQREILTLLKEIAIREEISLPQLLTEGAIQRLAADEALDGNQKIRHIRSYLRKRRFPRLTDVEATFEQCVRELKLGHTIRLSPPPGFEGKTCTVTIRFDSPEGLQAASRKLTELPQHPALLNLFTRI